MESIPQDKQIAMGRGPAMATKDLWLKLIDGDQTHRQ